MHKRDEATGSEILVPVANPDAAENLITLAAALSRGWDEVDVGIVALHVQQIRRPSLLTARRTSSTCGKRLAMQQAVAAGSDAGIPVQAAHCTARSAAAGILAVAQSRPDIRLILLGWHGPLALHRLRTSTDQEVAHSAPTNVAVLFGRELSSVQRILMPISGGQHARLGLRLASDMAKAGAGMKITVLRVLPPGANDRRADSEEGAARQLIGDELGSSSPHVRIRVVRAQSVVAGVLNAAGEGYDLIVIGASERGFVHNWLLGSIPNQVAEQAPCSVLMVKKREPSPVSWLRRTLKGMGT